MHRFLRRAHRLVTEASVSSQPAPPEQLRLLHLTIKKVGPCWGSGTAEACITLQAGWILGLKCTAWHRAQAACHWHKLHAATCKGLSRVRYMGSQLLPAASCGVFQPTRSYGRMCVR